MCHTYLVNGTIMEVEDEGTSDDKDVPRLYEARLQRNVTLVFSAPAFKHFEVLEAALLKAGEDNLLPPGLADFPTDAIIGV